MFNNNTYCNRAHKSKSLALCEKTGLNQKSVKSQLEKKWYIRRYNCVKSCLDLAWCLLRLRLRDVVPMPNGANISPDHISQFCMDSTTTYPGWELATQHLNTNKLFMKNQSTWPPYTQRCENVRTCQQHSASTTLFKQLINNYMPLSSNWSGLFRMNFQRSRYVQSPAFLILDHFSRPYRSFFWMFGKSEKVTRSLHLQTQQFMVPHFFVTDI